MNKLHQQILKVSVLYAECTNKAIKQTVGRIIAGDCGRVPKAPQRAETR